MSLRRLVHASVRLCVTSSSLPSRRAASTLLLQSTRADANSLTANASRYLCNSSTSNSADLTARLDRMVADDKVFIFMKGTPEEPMCGFSKLVCQVMKIHGVPFKSFNVLEDEEVRSGIKEYSEWPTIPQVYVGGEFLGGADIMVEMHQSGELIKTLKEHDIKSKLSDNA